MFVIQALVEITALFDDAVVPWDDKKLDDFLNIMHEEINGLHSCVSTVCVCVCVCVCCIVCIYMFAKIDNPIFNNDQKSCFFIVYSS